MKKKYYVTMDIGPNSGVIRDQMDENDATYDFEIMASEDEVRQLEKLFSDTTATDFRTFVKAVTPFRTQARQQESKKEDEQIDRIYRMIYELGTVKTRQKMQMCGLVTKEA